MNRVWSLLSPRYRFRDAISGRYVSKLYALAHPSTTVSERVDDPPGPRMVSGG